MSAEATKEAPAAETEAPATTEPAAAAEAVAEAVAPAAEAPAAAAAPDAVASKEESADAAPADADAEMTAAAPAEGNEETQGTKRAAPAEEEGAASGAPPKAVLHLAGLEFASRNEVWQHLHVLQQKLEEESASGPKKAEKADEFFLFSLLMMHPAAHEKMAPGVVAIGYGVNADFPDTKSFYVERTDGTTCGFSARKCVNIIFPEEASKPPSFSETPAAKRARYEGGNMSSAGGKGGKGGKGAAHGGKGGGKGGARYDRPYDNNNGSNNNGGAVGGHYGRESAPQQHRGSDNGDAAASSSNNNRNSSREGTYIQVGGLEGQAISFFELKEVLNKFATVRYVDMDSDAGKAVVRFDAPEGALKAVGECADVNGCPTTMRVMKPEEEEKYHQKCDAQRITREGAGGGGGRTQIHAGGGGRGGTPIRTGRGGGGKGGGKGGKGGGKGRGRGRF